MKNWFVDKDLLFYDPCRVVSSKIDFPKNEPEMTEFELAFLCGLIREKKPRKIVEVGIAAGGTTAIILECLSMLGMSETTELFSVDCSELFYRGKGEKSGYLADEYKQNSSWQGKHKMFLGKFLPEVLEEIGDDIDFVILDTVHYLPGEILDFLTIFPYLESQACVVLHDIALSHYFDNHIEGFATQVLLDSVVANKIVVNDDCRKSGYPNIGAFVIDDITEQYLANLFHALLITWHYLPSRRGYDLYLRFYEKHYPADLVKVASVAYELQSDTLRRKREMQERYKSTYSYRIGRMITSLPRMFKKLLVRR
jgi:predicted O-methyltransferase YrrM